MTARKTGDETAANPSLETFLLWAEQANVLPVSRTFVVDGLTPVAVAARFHHERGSYLLESVVGGDRWGRYSFVGFRPRVFWRGRGTHFECELAGTVACTDGRAAWDTLRDHVASWRPPACVLEAQDGEESAWPRFWGGAVGYVAYDAVRHFETTVPASSAEEIPWAFEWGVGGPVLVFDQLRQSVRIVVTVLSDESGLAPGPAHTKWLVEHYARAQEEIASILREICAPHEAAGEGSDALHPFELHIPKVDAEALPPSSFSRDAFEASVQKAQEHIRAGDIFQLVLSQRFRTPRQGTSTFDVYRAMRVVNPSPYMFSLNFGDLQLAGASPETLVRVERGHVQVRPLAGTRPRGHDDAHDQALEKELLADLKEVAEHVMLVDLGRNDVGRVCEGGSVVLSDVMAIERYSHVMHIVSNVSGRLRAGMNALNVLAATFPAGTLSGAPKVRAMQIIETLEPEARGIYGGAVGYIGFDGNLDVAIAIRTVVAHPDSFWVQAGAGVVEESDPAREYEETVNKARGSFVALEMAKGIGRKCGSSA